MIGLTFIVFILSHVSGTNVILSGYMNPKITGVAKEMLIQKLTDEFHLNQPIYVQYFYWLYQILRGNWGFTNTPIFSGSVDTAIALYLPNTLMISVFASILIWVIGVPLGVFSANNRDSVADHTLRVGSFTLYSMPIYLIGVVLILVIGVYLKILPFSGVVNPISVSGLSWYVNGISYPTHIILIDAIIHNSWGIAADAFLHLILPSVTLALAIVASMIRILQVFDARSIRSRLYQAGKVKGDTRTDSS